MGRHRRIRRFAGRAWRRGDDFRLEATIATVIINGVVFLIAGAAEIGIGMHAQGWSRFFLWVIGGILYLFVGLVCIFNPLFASAALTLMLGAGLIAAGAVRVYLAFELPPTIPAGWSSWRRPSRSCWG